MRQRLRSKDSPPFRLHACDWTARLRERWQTEIRTAFAMRLRCLIAAKQGRADVVALLLELGMNVDVADAIEQRGLHNAVAGGAIDVVKLLVAHGADIDRPTTQAGGGALGFAAHFDRREIAALLAPLSRDIPELIYLGMTDRVRELLAADPKLANAVHPKAGITPLFCLPDDEDQAVEMTALPRPRCRPNFQRQGRSDCRRGGAVGADLSTQPI